MNTFDILQIGEEAEPTDGLPDGCDLCGHCRMLRHILAEGAPLPCGAAHRASRAAATSSDPQRAGRRQPTRSTELATIGAN